MKKYTLYSFIFLLITVFSCGDDDGILEGQEFELRPLSEVEVEDDAEIREFLETHYYNYQEFENPPAGFDFKVRFETIDEETDPSIIPLIDQVNSLVINQASSDFGFDDGEEIDHTLYFLEVLPGVGGSPTIGDRVVLQYKGTLLDGTEFDSVASPINQYLSGGFVEGYSNGVINFSAGVGPVENGDGTVTYEDFGIGVIFMPSGLGFFATAPTNADGSSSAIPAYSPLIFEVNLFEFEENTDFDGDGIPSILEDVDGDGNLNNDNTDVEGELVFIPNHRDPDDDDDGILTLDEIDVDADGNFVGFRDTDNDGIPDHLDNDN